MIKTSQPLGYVINIYDHISTSTRPITFKFFMVVDQYTSSFYLFTWFADNQMQVNVTNSHILFSTNTKVVTKVDSAEIENS